MEQRKNILVPMLIFASFILVLLGCSKQHNHSTISSDKTISIQQIKPIVSRMYYAAPSGLEMKNVQHLPKAEDLDYLEYCEIVFKGSSDTLIFSCKGANGEIKHVYLKYKFEDEYLKVFNPQKPLWEVIGYGDKNRLSFFIDYVVYKDRDNGTFWINLDFCPEITIEDALQLDESYLFSKVSDLTLGNISSDDDLQNSQEKIYWRLIAYILE